MKYTFLNMALVIFIVLLPINAKAGLIIDTNRDSFIDVATGLEWMDFNVSNSYSYNDSVNQLEAGGTYDGWSLATQAQVFYLWDQTFFGITNKNYEPNQFGENWGYINSDGWSLGEQEQFEMLFNIMGSSDTLNSGTHIENKRIFSVFSTDTNSIAITVAGIYKDSSMGHYAQREDMYHPNALSVSGSQYEVTKYSMMLVRVASVPEPSTLAIFALGMIGVSSLRFKKQS